MIFATVLTLLALDVAVRVFWTSFVFQVARVEGHAMSPTLNDQDRLIVNKVAFRLRDPRAEDIVMLYYPIDPDKVFVKRIIAEEGDAVQIRDGRVFRNDVPLDDSYVAHDARSHDHLGACRRSRRVLLRHG